ncbi:MAG: right-handed parallel beta-helix repeat-containing protein [Planctomycetota bacterium]
MRSCIVFALLSVASVHAADLIVPRDFPSIQAAIDAAAIGDRVVVQEGLYPEVIDFRGKPITVLALGSPDRTIIDGTGLQSPVVAMTSGETEGSRLEGFTISGGAEPHGGILVRNGSPALSRLIIRENEALQGGGLRVVGGSPLVESCHFLNNVSLDGGGAFVQGARTVFRDVMFEGNDGGNFGGGLSAAGGTLRLENVWCVKNDANQFGGDLYTNHVELEAIGLTLLGNGTAEQSGNSWIFSTFGGGGAYLTSTSGHLFNVRARDNVAAAGGGLYVASGGGPTITNAFISDNLGGIAGAGVYCNSSSPRIVNATIVDNFPGGLFTTYNAFPEVVNVILAQNGDRNYRGVEVYGNGRARVSYSLVAGPLNDSIEIGSGVIGGLPRLGSDGIPLPGSPVIDAGLNSAFDPMRREDLAGNQRFVDDPNTEDTGEGRAPIIDLGAFEFPHGFGASPSPHR